MDVYANYQHNDTNCNPDSTLSSFYLFKLWLFKLYFNFLFLFLDLLCCAEYRFSKSSVTPGAVPPCLFNPVILMFEFFKFIAHTLKLGFLPFSRFFCIYFVAETNDLLVANRFLPGDLSNPSLNAITHCCIFIENEILVNGVLEICHVFEAILRGIDRLLSWVV